MPAGRLALGAGRPSPRPLVQFAFGILVTLAGMAVLAGFIVMMLLDNALTGPT